MTGCQLSCVLFSVLITSTYKNKFILPILGVGEKMLHKYSVEIYIFWKLISYWWEPRSYFITTTPKLLRIHLLYVHELLQYELVIIQITKAFSSIVA